MSKSLGNVIRPLDLKDKYGLDAFRYFLLREMVFGLDSSFSEEGFVQRVNADLANDLGNLVSRVTAMAVKYCKGSVPTASSEADTILSNTAVRVIQEVEASFRELTFQGPDVHLGSDQYGKPLHCGKGTMESGQGSGKSGHTR
jgi:methionyl-tRNA synthetase